MKKIRYILILLISASCMIGCDSLEDIYKEYTDQGERIYVGKADSISVFGGYNRVKIVALMHYAKTAESCMIRWETETGKDSLQVLASNWQENDSLEIIIGGLEEGAQRFFLQTYDKEGNSSLNVECNGYTYGDGYILTSTPKIITQMIPSPDGSIQLSWSISEDASFVEAKYESTSGMKTLELPGNVSSTILTDWKLGGSIEVRTRLIPEANTIDVFYTEWFKQQFPEFVEYALEKSKITYVDWGTNSRPGYGGRTDAVFDGLIDGGNQFHSTDGVGVPQHLVYDLGVIANLTRFEIWARSDGYNNWNPKIVQIWGIEAIDENSEVSLPSMDEGWEDEAVVKGWELLTESVCPEPVQNNLEIENPAKARYIMIRIKEVHGDPKTGGGAYVIIQEMALYADSIEQLN